jgi:hypothetical protein
MYIFLRLCGEFFGRQAWGENNSSMGRESVLIHDS